MIRVTVYAGPSATDERESSVVGHVADDADVHELLRQIGLEWKTADYFPQRQVVITLDPVNEDEAERASIKASVKEAAAHLEQTGLL